MAKEYKLQIATPPVARGDGSGYIGHNVWKVWREDIALPDDPWIRTPRHKDGIPVPYSQINTILALPTNQEKIVAYRIALIANKDVQPVANKGWSDSELDSFYAENDAATAAAEAVAQFVADLGKEFPVEF